MLKKVIIAMAFIMSILTLWGCTESKAKTVKDTSPFEYKIVSEGENTCRIAEIRIKKDKGISELKIPGTINGKTVVSIGVGKKKDKWNDEVRTSAFFMYLADDCEWYMTSGSKVQERRARKIKKILLPDTIEEIRDYAFAGLSGLKTIKLPKNLTTIGRCAFADTSIQKMHLPSNLTAIGTNLFFKSPIKDINIPANLKDGIPELARATVSWKRFSVSKENPYYKVKKGLLFSKDGKTLYAMITPQKNIRIPDSVKTITKYAFCNLSLESVYLGAGVKELQLHALSTKTRCKFTLSPENPYLAKSGMCIYHKKKRELLVAIPKSHYERTSAKINKRKICILRIPRKVKKVGKTMSTVGDASIRKLYYPKRFDRITLWNRSSALERGLILDEECACFEY